MKSKLIIIIALLNITLVSKAQDSDERSSNAGIKFGYNIASVSFDGDSETGQRHGFHAGFYTESFLSKSVALQIEILYSQQGYEIKNNSGTFTQKLNYINLPLLFRAYPVDHFFLEIGPQIGFALSHKEEFDSSFNLFDTEQEFDPKNFDWGVNIGAGFKTDSGVSIGVRYHYGLGDIYSQGNPQNRVLQFSLGIDF